MTKLNKMSLIINLIEDPSRLKPLTNRRPIGTLPFGGRHRLIDFPLSAATNADILDVMVTSPTSGRSVQDHIRSGQAWGLDTIRGGIFIYPYSDLRNVSETKKGALQNHYFDNEIAFLTDSDSEYTVIMGTQNINNIDLLSLKQYHREHLSPITLAFKNKKLSDISDDELILIFKKGKLSDLQEFKQVKTSVAIETEFLPVYLHVALIDTGLLIDYAYAANYNGVDYTPEELILNHLDCKQCSIFEYTGYHFLIKDLQSFFAANMSVLDPENFNSLFYTIRPIYTKAKNEAPTEFFKNSYAKRCLIGTGSMIQGLVKHSVIARNVTLKRSSHVENSIVFQGSSVGEGVEMENAILDKNVTIAPGLKIIGSKEHPKVVAKGQIIKSEGDLI